jgi:hypothetical protein
MDSPPPPTAQDPLHGITLDMQAATLHIPLLQGLAFRLLDTRALVTTLLELDIPRQLVKPNM